MTTMSTKNGGPASLRLSGDRMTAAAASGRLDAEALATAAAFRTIAAWTLVPAPRDPRAHVWAAHAEARPYLTRLTRHPADHEVASVMTADLFRRLTRRPAAGDTASSDRPTTPKPTPDPARYTYTPRKVLRRVLDHALDHLNQIDQWRAWQRAGVIPTPTDGWASSTVTLPEDRLPLVDMDLEAWVWRIDQAIRLLGQRADKLTDDELDWAPPDGGWPCAAWSTTWPGASSSTPPRSTRPRRRIRSPATSSPVVCSRRVCKKLETARAILPSCT